MSYEQSLQDLLEEIETCESIVQVSKTVDTAYTTNEAIKDLNVESWKIRITDNYTWAIRSSDTSGEGVYERLDTSSFESFKDSLAASVIEHLKKVGTREYNHIKDFREKAVVPAVAVINNLTEDVYEDVMFNYRSGKDHEKLVAGIEQRKNRLRNHIVTVAEAWVKEDIAAGAKVYFDSSQVLTVDKVVRMGGSTIITFKDSELTSYNFGHINFLETWFLNVENARDILERINSISY